MRRSLAILLAVSLVAGVWAPAAFAQQLPVGTEALNHIEEVLYGRQHEGSLVSRLERAEIDLLGRTQEGSAFLVRLQRLQNMLSGFDGESIKLKLAATEWALFRKVNDGVPVSRRLDEIEMVMFGSTSTDMGLVERLNHLLQMMWPGGKVYTAQVNVRKSTLVHIELLTEINSETQRVGDEVRYRVVDDVRVDNAIAIAAGTEGVGRVIAVEPSATLGRDGRVQVDFGAVLAMDSSPVQLQMAERAQQQNQSLELAAGASLAGIVLLGNPIGLAAGAFVRGRPHTVPAGTRFYVEVATDTTVNALSLVPVAQSP